MQNRYYIAYGSNLNLAQMHHRCPAAKVVGTAIIPDYRLKFKGSKTGAYLTIEAAAGYSVPVAIWEVTATDERVLDVYEGFPHFYYKKDMTLNIKMDSNNQIVEQAAFAYIMHEERDLGIPNERYLQTCIDGYHSFGFNTDFLLDAYEYTLKEMSK